jgi:hypothetical protein
MRTPSTFTIIAALFLSSGAIAQNKPDEIKQRVLSQAQSIGPDDYAFTRTIKSESTSNGKTEQHVNIDKFDPTKSGDARWTLVSRDGAPPSADVLSQLWSPTATTGQSVIADNLSYSQMVTIVPRLLRSRI